MKHKPKSQRIGTSHRKVHQPRTSSIRKTVRPHADHSSSRSNERPNQTRAAVGSEGLQQGWLSMTPRGFGFVTTANATSDIFIPPGMTGGALHGDWVEVQTSTSNKGLDGRVTKVLRRGLKELTGIIRLHHKVATFDTEDPRLPSIIHVEEPLDTEWNRAAREGQVFLAEITHYPTHPDEPPVVKVVRVLGDAGVARVEVEKIKVRENVIESFDTNVEGELEQFSQAQLEQVAQQQAKRRDVRSIPLLTIDPDDARDHDDAVWVEKRGSGYRVIVAIADVSFFVEEDTALDAAALARGCSVYLPDRAIPMLPDQLSGNLASLKEGVDRLTLAVEIEINDRGDIERAECFEGVMRAAARLTYAQVASALGQSHSVPAGPAQAHLSQLKMLLEISERLRAQRVKHGGLDFDLPEARVRVDNVTGEPIDAIQTRQDPGIKRAYQIIEDFMLLANVAVAQLLNKARVPAVYRIHGPPSEKKLEQFAEVAASYGHHLQSTDQKSLQQFLKRIEGRPEAQTLSYLLLRSMDQATYALENIGHFGLGFSHYVHFTSPIRRYPDLLVHRQVKKHLIDKKPPPKDAGTLQALAYAAALSSKLERRAMTVEREVSDLYKTILMRDQIGNRYTGRISHLSQQGFFVSIPNPAVEVYCRLSDLKHDHYFLDDLGIRWVGRKTKLTYSLGDELEVETTDISIINRHIYAVPLTHGKRLERSLTRKKTQPPQKDQKQKHKRQTNHHRRRR